MVGWRNAVAISLDDIALLGVALLLIAIARMALDARWDAGSPAIYLLAIAVVFLGSRDVWIDAYQFRPRPLALLLLVFLEQRFSLAALAAHGHDRSPHLPRLHWPIWKESCEGC